MTLRHHLHHVTHVVVDGDHRWVVLLLEMMAQRLLGSLSGDKIYYVVLLLFFKYKISVLLSLAFN